VKVLLVQTTSLGDIVQTFPAVTDAARHVPDLELHWLAEETFADVAALHPAVARVHRCATRRWRRRPQLRTAPGELRALRRALRAERYDAVVDAQGLLKSAALARLAGAPIHGFDRRSTREFGTPLAYRGRHRVLRGGLASSRYRALLAASLGYPLDGPAEPGLRPADPADVEPHTLLLHGTSDPAKELSPERWADLAREALAAGRPPAALWHGERERAFVGALRARVPELVDLGDPPMLEVLRVVSRASHVIGVDTGLVHLAAAYGRPTTALFTTSDPTRFAPVGLRVRTITPTTG